MTSQGEKMRRLRLRQAQGAGRPRKPGDRYPSGKLKPSETEAEVKSVAIAAAKRIHQIDTDGKDGLHGYTLGRMFLDKKISHEELQAGNWFTEQVERYYRAVGIPSPNPRAQDLLAVRGSDGEVSQSAQDRARRATNMFMRLETVLGSIGAGVKSTVFNVCVMDMEGLRLMPASQLALLRAGLRALLKAKGAT